MAPEPEQKKMKLTLEEGMLLGMGNPLLDISTVCGQDFLEKYDLKSNNAILAEEKHLPMYRDMVDTMKVDYIPGGATLNSIRIAQWILEKPNVASYFGCIGSDEFGQVMTTKASEAGINVKFQVNSEQNTGTCAVLVTGKERSLVANLAAANHFKRTHFDVKENWDIVEKASFYYIAGFFLTVSPESILEVAKHAADNNKVMMLNLSAPFLCQFFSEPMMKVLPYCDIVFGNETEAAEFSEAQKFGTKDIKEIALKTAALDKVNQSRQRMVIFTQGCEPTIVAYEGKIQEFPVIKIKADEIVDTNGAGDAFVGGFLSQYVLGKDLHQCVRVGNYAANYIIQQSGVTVSDKAQPPTA